MAIEEFGRDLGYLEKFFDKLEGHASTLGGSAGTRLLELMAEERGRWAEIRSLLTGGEAKPTEPTAPPAPSPTGDPQNGAGPGPVVAHVPHPYSRALETGLAMLPRAEIGQAPPATPAREEPSRGPKVFTVGSLRRKS